MNFSRHLSSILMLVQIFVFGAGAVIVYNTTSSKLRQAFVQRADTLTSAIAASAQVTLCLKNQSEMSALLKQINQSSHLEYIVIREGNSILASTGNLSIPNAFNQLNQLDSSESTKIYASFSEIPNCVAGRAPYELEVGNNFKDLTQPLNSLLWIQGLVVITKLFLFLAFGYIYSRLLSGRLKEILNACKKISAGNFDIVVSSKGNDDFSKILSQVQLTGQSLKQLVSERDKQRVALTANAKMSSLGEMAGGIAHEINNPLAIIKGKTASVKRQINGDNFDKIKINEELVKIETTTERIAKIIRGLRSFSRNAAADPMERVQLSTIISDTLELCKERFRTHSIDLRVDCAIDAKIECRPAQISQILINLLGNAHDAVNEFSEKWVSLEVGATLESVTIKITDSGNGIPPDVAEKMMQPFFTTKEVGKGTGLGLSISKGIVEDHHGRMFYDSNSKNTRFVIELPLKQPVATSQVADLEKKAA